VDKLIKLAEAQRLTGVSRKTLLRRIASGELEAHKTGRGVTSHYLVSEAALARCFARERPERVAS
jgi:excisionase family DNA binding protein